MSSGDLLEDLRSNRQRAVVPDRNDPLLPKPSDVQQTPEPTFDLDYPDELTKTLIDPVPSQSEPSTSACDRFGEEERGGGLVPTDKSGGINDSPKSPPPLSQAFLGENKNQIRIKRRVNSAV